MRKYRSLLLLGLLSINLAVLANVLTPVAGVEDWEDADLTWYYDNLNDTERKMIRQAFDYCVPRQQVIDGLMKGYAYPLATEVGTNIIGYDPTVQPRSYSTSKALDLLTEVFGKRYDVNEDPNETYTNTPYFKMTLISPTTNVARTQWASMISFALTNVGIDVELKWWNWNIIMPRLFLDPAEPTGANYEHGGFDAYFIGFGASADPDYSGQYYNDSFAPAGDNSMYVERKDFQDIIKRSLESPLEADRLQALKEYQAWFYEWVPKSIIRQAKDTFPQDPDMEGFDTYNYGRYPWVHNITIDGATTMTSLVPGDFVDFNPLVSNSWYDSVPMTNVFESLSARRGIYNLSAYPMLAENWTQSPDGKNWTIHLKQGLKFSDGSDITSDDVVETYRVAMNASTSTIAGDMATWFRNDTDVYAEGDYIIHMDLQVFYPYVTTAVFGLPILKMEQLREIGIDNLKTDTSNTNSPMDLIGSGPFKASAYVTNQITLVPNTEYDGAIRGDNPADGIFLADRGEITTYICKVVKEATAAVTELSTGACDLMDPNQGIFGQIEDMEEHPEWAKIIVAPEYGWQELSYNHYDPRWGLNPHDPREMYPDEYTTEVTTTEAPAETTTTEAPAETTTTEEPTTTAPGFELVMVLFAAGIFVAARPLRRKK